MNNFYLLTRDLDLKHMTVDEFKKEIEKTNQWIFNNYLSTDNHMCFYSKYDSNVTLHYFPWTGGLNLRIGAHNIATNGY